MVLTFSRQRILDRLLTVVAKLNFKRTQTNEEIITLVHRILRECDNEEDARMHTFVSIYVSNVGYLLANMLVESAAVGEVFMPINPQYSISFNDKKFNNWLKN